MSSEKDEWVPGRDDGSAHLGARGRPWARHAPGLGPDLARGRQPARGGLPARARVAALAPHHAGCDEPRDPRGIARGMRLAAFRAATPPARAALKKGMWGPVRVNGASQFPVYRELGATVYNTGLNWRDVAVRRPTNPRDPREPAYRWPAGIRRRRRASRCLSCPAGDTRHGNANLGERGSAGQLGSVQSRRLRRLLVAAARRYPSVRFWIIWGEPTRVPETSSRSRRGRVPARGCRRRRDRSFLRADTGRFICGLEECFQTKDRHRRELVHCGDISPLNWIRYVRLPAMRTAAEDGSLRPQSVLRAAPPLAKRAARPRLRRLLRPRRSRALAGPLLRSRPTRKPMRHPDGEWSVPTDHESYIFNFWTTRRTQASWLRAALRIARSWPHLRPQLVRALRRSPTPGWR